MLVVHGSSLLSRQGGESPNALVVDHHYHCAVWQSDGTAVLVIALLACCKMYLASSSEQCAQRDDLGCGFLVENSLALGFQDHLSTFLVHCLELADGLRDHCYAVDDTVKVEVRFSCKSCEIGICLDLEWAS
eukprot:3167399-Rhodomonas_salina.2